MNNKKLKLTQILLIKRLLQSNQRRMERMYVATCGYSAMALCRLATGAAANSGTL